MSSEQNPGHLLYTGDYILPSYIIGIIICHYKDPYEPIGTGISQGFERCITLLIWTHVARDGKLRCKTFKLRL